MPVLADTWALNVAKPTEIPWTTIPPIPERQGPGEPEQLLSEPPQEDRDNSRTTLNICRVPCQNLFTNDLEGRGLNCTTRGRCRASHKRTMRPGPLHHRPPSCPSKKLLQVAARGDRPHVDVSPGAKLTCEGAQAAHPLMGQRCRLGASPSPRPAARLPQDSGPPNISNS